MHYLLDRVHTELLQSTKFSNGKDTIVTSIFGGNLQSEVSHTGILAMKLILIVDMYLFFQIDMLVV